MKNLAQVMTTDERLPGDFLARDFAGGVAGDICWIGEMSASGGGTGVGIMTGVRRTGFLSIWLRNSGILGTGGGELT